MFRDYTLQTTWGRALVALVVGAVVAALILDGYGWIKYNLEFEGMFGYSHLLSDFDTALALVIGLAAPLAGWGMWAMVFSLLWLLLHKFGYRTWLSLLLCGFAFSFIVFFVGFTNFLTGTRDLPEHLNNMPLLNNDPQWDGRTLTALGWKLAALKATGLGAVAAASALTIWCIAYQNPAQSMFTDYTLHTTRGRALKSLALGCGVGALIVGSFALLEFRAHAEGYIYYLQGRDTFGTAKILAIAFGVPLMGLGIWAVFFAPIWLMLHKRGYRPWLSMLLAGFALTFIGVFTVSTHFLTGSRNWPEHLNAARNMSIDPRWHGAIMTALGWLLAAFSAVIYGILGAIVALTIWRIAYRRPPPC